MRVNHDDAAREEGLAAAAWYGVQQEALQIRFLAKLKEAELTPVFCPRLQGGWASRPHLPLQRENSAG